MRVGSLKKVAVVPHGLLKDCLSQLLLRRERLLIIMHRAVRRWTQHFVVQFLTWLIELTVSKLGTILSTRILAHQARIRILEVRLGIRLLIP